MQTYIHPVANYPEPGSAHLGEKARRRAGGSAATLLALALLALALLFPVQAQALAEDTQQDDVLAGVDKFALGAANSSEVTLDKNMLGLAGGMLQGKDANMKGLMKQMESVLVRDYEYSAPGKYRMDDVEQIRKRLDTGGWSHLVREHSATENTDICVKTDAEGMMSEMVIIDAEPKELSFIHLKGRMSPKDLAGMSGGFGGPPNSIPDPTLKQRTK